MKSILIASAVILGLIVSGCGGGGKTDTVTTTNIPVLKLHKKVKLQSKKHSKRPAVKKVARAIIPPFDRNFEKTAKPKQRKCDALLVKFLAQEASGTRKNGFPLAGTQWIKAGCRHQG